MELPDTAEVIALPIDVYGLADQVVQQRNCKQEMIQFLLRISSYFDDGSSHFLALVVTRLWRPVGVINEGLAGDTGAQAALERQQRGRQVLVHFFLSAVGASNQVLKSSGKPL